MSLREKATHKSLMQLFSHIDNEGGHQLKPCIVFIVLLCRFPVSVVD